MVNYKNGIIEKAEHEANQKEQTDMLLLDLLYI